MRTSSALTAASSTKPRERGGRSPGRLSGEWPPRLRRSKAALRRMHDRSTPSLARLHDSRRVPRLCGGPAGACHGVGSQWRLQALRMARAPRHHRDAPRAERQLRGRAGLRDTAHPGGPGPRPDAARWPRMDPRCDALALAGRSRGPGRRVCARFSPPGPWRPPPAVAPEVRCGPRTPTCPPFAARGSPRPRWRRWPACPRRP